MSAENATPSTTEEPSPESGTAGADEPKIVHGHVGAGPCGVTAFDIEAGPVPAALVAATLNVYVVPLERPVTVAETDDPATTVAGCATEPMNGVTV